MDELKKPSASEPTLADRRRRNDELLDRLLSDARGLTQTELLEFAEYVLEPMLSRRRP